MRLGILLAMAAAIAAPAQQGRFEVSSVKPCPPEPQAAGRRKGDGRESSPIRLHLPCQTVMSLVQWAYVNFAQDRFDPLGNTAISGGPSWINSEQYEIDATSDAPQSEGVLNGAMLRRLLEERFQVKLRQETRQTPAYALMRAGKGPARLKPSDSSNCIAFDPSHPPPLPEAGKPLPLLCGMSRLTNDGFDATGVTMANLSRILSDNTDRRVVDRTGIPGMFDIHLNLFAADLGRPGTSPNDPADVTSRMNAELRKLGLKLLPTIAPEEVLIIDSVERPFAN
jgi:uncharacterized protein (TIGR03435 family)